MTDRALVNDRASSIDTTPARIVVSGTGSATTQPDHAIVHFEARVVRPTPTEALADVTLIASSVTHALGDLGIGPDAIVTSPGHVDRERNWDSGQERIVGWYAGYSVQAKIDAPSIVFATLLEVSRIADVTSGQPMWQVAPTNPAWERARHAAVADARATAEHYADAAGLRLGPLLELQEGSAMGGGPFPKMAMLRADAGSAPDHGLETVTASVTLTYTALPK